VNYQDEYDELIRAPLKTEIERLRAERDTAIARLGAERLATPPMARENERLRAAGKKIIEADDEFRASLGPHWEGDPVSDACDAARDLFCLNQQLGPGSK